jgi:uncharacterized protein
VRPRDASSALSFPLAGLLAEPAGVSRTYDFDDVPLSLGDDLELASGVSGRLQVTRTNRGLYARADARGQLRERCSRCLREIGIQVDVVVEEEVLPSIDLSTGLAMDSAAEPDVIRLTGAHELALEPLLRDAITLAEPIAPLCRPDCPGLSPICGLDLSEPGHEPHEVELDPRLEALRSFRVDESAETD